MKVSTFPKERMSIRMGVSVSVTWLWILSGGWRLFSIDRGDVCNSEESSGRESTELKLFTLRLNHDRVVSWFNFRFRLISSQAFACCTPWPESGKFLQLFSIIRENFCSHIFAKQQLLLTLEVPFPEWANAHLVDCSSKVNNISVD